MAKCVHILYFTIIFLKIIVSENSSVKNESTDIYNLINSSNVNRDINFKVNYKVNKFELDYNNYTKSSVKLSETVNDSKSVNSLMFNTHKSNFKLLVTSTVASIQKNNKSVEQKNVSHLRKKRNSPSVAETYDTRKITESKSTVTIPIVAKINATTSALESTGSKKINNSSDADTHDTRRSSESKSTSVTIPIVAEINDTKATTPDIKLIDSEPVTTSSVVDTHDTRTSESKLTWVTVPIVTEINDTKTTTNKKSSSKSLTNSLAVETHDTRRISASEFTSVTIPIVADINSTKTISNKKSTESKAVTSSSIADTHDARRISKPTLVTIPIVAEINTTKTTTPDLKLDSTTVSYNSSIVDTYDTRTSKFTLRTIPIVTEINSTKTISDIISTGSKAVTSSSVADTHDTRRITESKSTYVTIPIIAEINDTETTTSDIKLTDSKTVTSSTIADTHDTRTTESLSTLVTIPIVAEMNDTKATTSDLKLTDSKTVTSSTIGDTHDTRTTESISTLVTIPIVAEMNDTKETTSDLKLTDSKTVPPSSIAGTHNTRTVELISTMVTIPIVADRNSTKTKAFDMKSSGSKAETSSSGADTHDTRRTFETKSTSVTIPIVAEINDTETTTPNLKLIDYKTVTSSIADIHDTRRTSESKSTSVTIPIVAKVNVTKTTTPNLKLIDSKTVTSSSIADTLDTRRTSESKSTYVTIPIVVKSIDTKTTTPYLKLKDSEVVTSPSVTGTLDDKSSKLTKFKPVNYTVAEIKDTKTTPDLKLTDFYAVTSSSRFESFETLSDFTSSDSETTTSSSSFESLDTGTPDLKLTDVYAETSSSRFESSETLSDFTSSDTETTTSRSNFESLDTGTPDFVSSDSKAVSTSLRFESLDVRTTFDVISRSSDADTYARMSVFDSSLEPSDSSYDVDTRSTDIGTKLTKPDTDSTFEITSVTSTPLIPNDTEITTYSSSTSSSTTPISITTITEPYCDYEITNLTIIPGEQNLYVTWNPPAEDCKLQYIVKWESNEETVNYTFYNIDRLEACTVYNVSVSAILIVNNTVISNIDGSESTSSMSPSSVQDLKLEPSDTTMKVTWNPPINGSRCIKKYRCEYWWFTDPTNIYNYSAVTNNTNIAISDLIPCSECFVQIIPVTESQNDGLHSISNETLLAKVNNPPQGFNDTKGKTWINALWKFDKNEKNYCAKKSLHVFCNSTDPDEGWRVNLSNTSVDLKDNKSEYYSNITNLSPYTSYNCYAFIENIKGNSSESKIIESQTDTDVPSEPEINEIRTTSNEIYISWYKPKKIPGNLQEYDVTIINNGPNYTIPENCEKHNISEEIFKSKSETYNYTLADPYTKYFIVIAANTEAGQGRHSEPKEILTNSSVSEKIRNLDKDLTPPNITFPNGYAKIKWKPPCKSHGILKYYKIKDAGSEIDEMTSEIFYEIKNLKPEYKYNFSIAPFVDSLGKINSISFETEAGIPIESKNATGSLKKPDPSKTDDPSTQAQITFSKSLFTTKNILYYSLIVSENNYETMTEGFLNPEYDWPNVNTWKDSNLNGNIYPYQTTPKKWNPFTKRQDGQDNVKYTLGEEDCQSSNEYCNGHLRPATDYVVVIRAFTKHGFKDFFKMGFQTEKALNLGSIFGILSSILFLCLIIVIFVYFKNGRKLTWPPNISILINNNQPSVPRPVAVNQFSSYCSKLISSEDRLRNEYVLLRQLSVGTSLSTATAELPHNRMKNRYPNIKPYDITRVKLQDVESEYENYINANYIKGFSGNVEYIAAQGPKDVTTGDFWQMIYENNVTQIIMVTQLVEKGKIKCYQYYPSKGDRMELDNGYVVRCTMELEYETYTLRVLQVWKDNTQAEVIHLHFTEWPDFGVPETTHSMIEFCQVIRHNHSQKAGIIVVHCSAGVGRTGTLITVDMMMQAIEQNQKIDVFGTILNLRKQRDNMVQTEAQYKYIHCCLRDHIQEPRKKNEDTSQEECLYENLPEICIYKKNATNPNTTIESVM